MSTDRLPPLENLRAFHQAALTLSFRQAAAAIGLTPSAISHRIRALEADLGTPLFHRLPRAIALTAEGEAYWRSVRWAFELLEEGTDAIVRDSRRGVLRVSALPFFTSICLIPHLTAFQKAHPEIELIIETNNGFVDFTREPIDIGIRFMEEPQSGLASQKLLDVRAVPVCAPGLLDGAHPLRMPEDLAQHNLIHVSVRPGAWARWLTGAGLDGLTGKADMSFDTVPAALQAAAEGHGVALGVAPLVWGAEVSYRLVRPFAFEAPTHAAYYLVHWKEDAAKPKVLAFKKWITREMQRLKRQGQRAGGTVGPGRT